MKNIFLFPVLIMFTIVVGCQEENASSSDPVIPSISFEQHGTLEFHRDGETLASIAIEIADNDSARVRGLMQRTELPESSGMLFIFPSEEPQGFWMGNTQMSLDLIFADNDSSIVSITRYAQPMAQETILSEDPARFTVEVPAGFADSRGILEGDRIRWTRN